MSLLNYVASYDDVRALLGVSVDELEDTVLGLKIYELGLEQMLNKVSSSLIAEYESVANVAVSSRTADQKRLFSAVQVFSTYHAADMLSAALPNSAPKTITDGKAMVQRQAGDLAALIRDGIRAGKSTALAELNSALAAVTGGPTVAATAFVGLLISSPDSDPVLGT